MGWRDYNVYLHIHQTQISGRFPSGSQSSSARPSQSKVQFPSAVGKCRPEGILWDRPSGTPPRCHTCSHFLEHNLLSTVNKGFSYLHTLRSRKACSVSQSCQSTTLESYPGRVPGPWRELEILILSTIQHLRSPRKIITLSPRKKTHRPRATAVLTTVLTLGHWHEAVEVSWIIQTEAQKYVNIYCHLYITSITFTSTIVELFTSLGLFVVSIASEISCTETGMTKDCVVSKWSFRLLKTSHDGPLDFCNLKTSHNDPFGS